MHPDGQGHLPDPGSRRQSPAALPSSPAGPPPNPGRPAAQQFELWREQQSLWSAFTRKLDGESRGAAGDAGARRPPTLADAAWSEHPAVQTM